MKLEIKKITGIALIAVLAYISMLIFKVPIQFLDFEIKDVVICIGGLIFGVVPAIIISFLVAFLELVTVSSSGLVGFFMNFTSTVFFVLPTVIIYKKTKKNVLIGVLIGTTLMTFSMILFNLIITPLYLDVSLEEVIALLVPLIIPFNIGKGLINGIVVILLYKPIIQSLNKSNLV